MSNLFCQTDKQMERLKPVFPKRHGKPRVDDRWGLKDNLDQSHQLAVVRRTKAVWPTEISLYNCWKRFRDEGIFAGSPDEGPRARANTEASIPLPRIKGGLARIL